MSTKIDADFGRASHALGMIDGLVATMDTNLFVSDAAKFLAHTAASHAGKSIDSMAQGTSTLNHVYEWNMAGNPAGRLFKFNVVGTGKSRTVQWMLLPSKKPIPTLAERIANGDIANIPNNVLEGLNHNQRHVFKTKAQMMEYGATAIIKPKRGKTIFIPFAEKTSYGHTYMFAKQAKVTFRYNRGRFQAAWKMAQIHAANKALNEMESLVAVDTKVIEQRLGKTSTKSMTIAFKEGQTFGTETAKSLEQKFKKGGLL